MILRTGKEIKHLLLQIEYLLQIFHEIRFYVHCHLMDADAPSLIIMVLQTHQPCNCLIFSSFQNVTCEEDPFVPTCQDLAGFWDMVHIQVEQIHKRFDDLRDLKRMNWVVKVSFFITHLDKSEHDHNHQKSQIKIFNFTNEILSRFAHLLFYFISCNL